MSGTEASNIVPTASIMKRWIPFCLLAIALTACNDSTNQSTSIDTQNTNDTAEVSEPVIQKEEKAFTRVPDRLFWKPLAGWVGDVMPFSNDNQIELYYLQDWRNDDPGFHPIFRATTTNLTDYTYHGEVIPISEVGKQDLAIGTGDVIKVGDTYHFYYTGHNWMFPDEGKPKEAVMHAVSKDLQNWTKIPEDTFYAPEGYEEHDFRDPFVIFNEDKQEYWMLVSGRQQGVSGGVLAVFASTDMRHWEVRDPLDVEDTDRYFMLECADLFKIGDNWYMLFSEFSDKGATHYRMSKSLGGPWVQPEQDLFDGKGFYAAKTGAIEGRHFLFGWVPTRQMEKDYMKWDWAGNLASHELIQNSDGTLSVKTPNEVKALFSQETPIQEVRKLGEVSGGIDEWIFGGESWLAGMVFDTLPATTKITGTVTFDEKVSYTGIVFGVGEEAEKAYGIQLEPGSNRMRYDAAPSHTLGSVDPDIQTPIHLEPGTAYDFTIIVENDVCSFYIQDSVALTTRIYKMPGQSWGWYSSGGTTTLKDLKMFIPST